MYFAEGYNPQLFNLEEDPYEENDLARDNNFKKILESFHGDLLNICNPEEVNKRAKREQNFRKSVKESMDDFGEEYLNEANVDVLKKIVKDKQNNKIKLKDGTVRVDLFTASAITQALEKVKPDTKKKMEDIINKGGKAQFMKLVGVVFK